VTYEHGRRQYVAILSGVSGWAGIGLAAGSTKPSDGLSASRRLRSIVELHLARGTLAVFALPSD